MPRIVPLAIAVGLLLSFSVAAAQDTLRINTRLVQVDVVVRDKNGPVTGLTKDDFTLFDNGKPQQIEVFSVSTTTPSRTTSAAPLPGGATISNRDALEKQGIQSVTVILFDVLNTAGEHRSYAVRHLIRYLKTLAPGDRVALYLLENELHVVQDFTSDAETLMRAALQIPIDEVPGNDLRNPVAMFRSFVPQMRSPMIGVGGPAFLPDETRRLMNFFGGVVGNNASKRVDPVADAMEAIARHLAPFPGRKNLVWLAGNIPLTPRSGTAPDGKESQIARATRLLNDANIAIYPIDVRGLSADVDDRRPGRLLANPPPDSMIRLADATGGRAAYWGNDIEAAVRSAVSDAEASYTLAFYPSEDGYDGKFHDLKVRVAGKGLDIRHREGYFATAPAPPSGEQRRQTMTALLNSPLNASQIGLYARVDRHPTLEGKLRVIVYIDAHDLQIEHRDSRWLANLDLAIRNETSTQKPIKFETLAIDLTEERYRQALQQGMFIDEIVVGEVPDARLLLIAQDTATGAAGSLWIPLQLTQGSK